MEKKLSKITERERKVYDYINEREEIIVSNLPRNMMGAIPKLENVGLIKTFRKNVTPWASKKHTFVKSLEAKKKVKIPEPENEEEQAS
jgi:hypothetical protein